MKRVLMTMGPIALVASGCEMYDVHANTPSQLAPAYEPEIGTQLTTVPTRDEAMVRWQLPPTNTWAAYQKLTLLTALGTSPRTESLPALDQDEAVRAAQTAAHAVADAGLPRDAMWVVDMRGAVSVGFASALTQTARGPVAAITTFNNWPADDEVVPAEETLAAMVTLSPRLPPPDAPTSLPLFLLDSWRLAYKEETIDEGTTDNRYMLSQADFPNADTLRDAGIRRVIYVVESLEDVSREEDDLNAVFLAYQREGIQIMMVDLAWLTPTQEEPLRARYAMWGERMFYVEHRTTICNDPAFYARARGGFGGVHGFTGGGSGHFGGHYSGGFHGGG